MRDITILSFAAWVRRNRKQMPSKSAMLDETREQKTRRTDINQKSA